MVKTVRWFLMDTNKAQTMRNIPDDVLEQLVQQLSNLTKITPVVTMKEQFLSDIQNVESFKRLLTMHFASSGITVSQAIADADTMIVTQAIERAMKGEISTIVGEDTSFLVLMIALVSDTVDMCVLIPSSMGKVDRIYRSKKLREALGELNNHIIFFMP